jgi:hypothetical protein
MTPRSVITALTRPPAVSMPRAAHCVNRVAPRRRAANANAGPAHCGSALPSLSQYSALFGRSASPGSSLASSAPPPCVFGCRTAPLCCDHSLYWHRQPRCARRTECRQRETRCRPDILRSCRATAVMPRESDRILAGRAADWRHQPQFRLDCSQAIPPFSTSTTFTPRLLRNSALVRPITPPPITTTSACDGRALSDSTLLISGPITYRPLRLVAREAVAMPKRALITSTASDAAKRRKARAAATLDDLVVTAPVKVVRCWISPGSGPTT